MALTLRCPLCVKFEERIETERAHSPSIACFWWEHQGSPTIASRHHLAADTTPLCSSPPNFSTSFTMRSGAPLKKGLLQQIRGMPPTILSCAHHFARQPKIHARLNSIKNSAKPECTWKTWLEGSKTDGGSYWEGGSGCGTWLLQLKWYSAVWLWTISYYKRTVNAWTWRTALAWTLMTITVKSQTGTSYQILTEMVEFEGPQHERSSWLNIFNILVKPWAEDTRSKNLFDISRVFTVHKNI